MRTRHSLLSVTFLTVVLMGQGMFAQENLPPEILSYADMIFHNGKILTADDSFAIAEAVAIREGKFLAVGDNARIMQMAGPDTRLIDLQGKTVTPGLIDTHFHLYNYTFIGFPNGGVEIVPAIYLADLEGSETKESFLRALRSKGQKVRPRDGWLVFTDWIGEAHGVIENQLIPQLTQQDLDEAFPDGPAAVGASHGNNYSAYILNSAGLKIALAKLPANTPGIVKDPSTGKPTGEFDGTAASLLGRGVLPWPDMERVSLALEKGIPMYTAQGLTMIQTKTPGYVMAALREFWKQGRMPIRWRANIDVGPDTEVAFKYLGNLTDLGDSWLRITSGPGGIPRSFWDATYQAPNPLPGWRGTRRPHQSLEERQAELQEPTDAFLAAKYGWSTSNVHNNGDMSTDAYLSEIEKGLQERPLEAHGQRFVTDHSLMLSPETPLGNQFERMKRLGIIPSLNAAYLVEPKPTGYDRTKIAPTQVELLSQKWGKERVAKMLPAKSLIEAGFKPTSESDRWYYPASYPLWILEKLVTRKDDKFGVVWGPQETVSRQEALWMKTNWAARYSGDENDLGTVEPGKLADLVVLDQDYMSVPEDDISTIQVLMTVIGGKVIYDADRDGRLPRPGENLPGLSGLADK